MNRTKNKDLTKPLARSFMFVIIALSALYSGIAPIIISFDGYLYLASAKSMFTPDFHPYYWLEKEPLFPLLLKLGTTFGIRFFVIVQGIITGVSICITLNTIKRYVNSNVYVLKAIGITSLLVFHGWSATLLQQTLFIFFTSLNIAFFCYFNTIKKYTRKIYVQVFGISLLNVTFSIVIFSAFLIALSIILLFKHKNRIKEYFVVGLVVVFTYVFFSVGWTSAIGNTKEGRIFQPPYKSILTQYFSTDDPMLQWEQRLQTTTALLSIGKENFGVPGMNLPISFEVRAYGLTHIDDAIKCGKRDPGFEPTVLYVSSLLGDKDCIESGSARVINWIHFWTFPLIPLLGFAFLGLGVIGLVRPQSKVFYSLVLFPAAIWLEYVAVGGGSSRYGVPCIYAALYLVANLANEWESRTSIERK